MKLLRIGMKDLLVQVRDLPALAVMLGMPMVLIFILGSALGGLTGGDAEVSRIDVAVVDEDGGEIASRVADAFLGSEDLGELFAAVPYDEAGEARDAVERGDLAAALVIPEGFSADVEAAEPTGLEVLADPGTPVPAGIFRSVVESVATRITAASVAAQTTGDVLGDSRMVSSAEEVGRYVDEAAEAASAEDALEGVQLAETEAEGGTEWDALDYYAGGMSVMFLLFGAMFGAFSVVKERRDMTLSRLLSTPTPRWAVVGGKMAGVFVLGVLQFAVLYAFTLSLGVDWGDSVAGLWLVIVGEVLAVTGLSVAISSIAKSQRQVGAIAPVVIQILAAAGGSFIPVAVFPAWLQPLHYLTPNGWALDGIQALREGAGVAAVLPNVAALGAIALALALLGVWRLRAE